MRRLVQFFIVICLLTETLNVQAQRTTDEIRKQSSLSTKEAKKLALQQQEKEKFNLHVLEIFDSLKAYQKLSYAEEQLVSENKSKLSKKTTKKLLDTISKSKDLVIMQITKDNIIFQDASKQHDDKREILINTTPDNLLPIFHDLLLESHKHWHEHCMPISINAIKANERFVVNEFDKTKFRDNLFDFLLLYRLKKGDVGNTDFLFEALEDIDKIATRFKNYYMTDMLLDAYRVIFESSSDTKIKEEYREKIRLILDEKILKIGYFPNRKLAAWKSARLRALIEDRDTASLKRTHFNKEYNKLKKATHVEKRASKPEVIYY